jgi:GTPase SAR1 family protein
MTVDGTAYNLKVIDIPGGDEMEGITGIAIKDADAFMIVYSVASALALRLEVLQISSVFDFHSLHIGLLLYLRDQLRRRA